MKSVTLPIANHFKISSEQSPKTEKEFDRMSKVPYSSTIGFIMYII